MQLITACRTIERVTTPQKPTTYVNRTSIGPGSLLLYGVAALDDCFPYPNGAVWDVSEVGTGYDSPQQPIWVANLDGGGENWFRATADDSFSTYMMYRPPSKDGLASVWIPIAKYSWAWGNTATKGPPGYGWVLDEGNVTCASTSRPETGHPTWSRFSPSPFYFGPAG